MYDMCFLSVKHKWHKCDKSKILKICNNKYQPSLKEPNIVEALNSCIKESIPLLSDTCNVPNPFESLDEK